MTHANLVILAAKSCAVDRYLRGHSTAVQFHHEFAQFDQPPAWADTPLRTARGGLLLLAAVLAWEWMLH